MSQNGLTVAFLYLQGEGKGIRKVQTFFQTWHSAKNSSKNLYPTIKDSCLDFQDMWECLTSMDFVFQGDQQKLFTCFESVAPNIILSVILTLFHQIYCWISKQLRSYTQRKNKQTKGCLCKSISRVNVFQKYNCCLNRYLIFKQMLRVLNGFI